MTLYQKIIEILKKQPMQFASIVEEIKAPIESVRSAVRDLLKYGYISATGPKWRYVYAATEKAASFVSLFKSETGRKQVRKQKTTTEYAVTHVPNSVFNIAFF